MCVCEIILSESERIILGCKRMLSALEIILLRDARMVYAGKGRVKGWCKGVKGSYQGLNGWCRRL